MGEKNKPIICEVESLGDCYQIPCPYCGNIVVYPVDFSQFNDDGKHESYTCPKCKKEFDMKARLYTTKKEDNIEEQAAEKKQMGEKDI